MLNKDFIQSITILSLLQLVFSERSANNVYSYLCPHSPTARMIDIGAAFTLLRIPVSNKLSKCSNNGGSFATFVDHQQQNRPTWGFKSHANNVPNIIGMKMNYMNTERNLFSFNLNEMMKGNESEIEVRENETEEKKKVVGTPWKAMITKYQQNSNDEKRVVPEKEIDDEESQTNGTFSLSSLINVEALLLASGQVELDTQDETSRTTLLEEMMKRGSTSSINNNNDQKSPMKEITASASIEESVNMKNAEEQLSWKALTKSFQQSLQGLVESPSTFTPSFELSMAAEVALKEASHNIEEFMNDAASSFSSDKVQTLIASTSRNLAVDQNADVFKETMDKVVAAAETLAKDQGVDVSDAAMQARATTKQTAEFLQVANGVLLSGYVRGGVLKGSKNNAAAAEIWNVPTSDETNAKPLFEKFESVEAIANEEFRSVVLKGAEMAMLSGAIYQETIERTHAINHSFVANGTTADVAWMVTDNISYEQDFKEYEELSNEAPVLVRTITLRGYDASDESVDREKLLYKICDAAPVPLGAESTNLNVHQGLLQVAKELYKEILQYIDMTGPNHKVVLNGHSIGGSLAIMILFLLTQERGADFVNEKIQRVFTYGSPPIATLTNAALISSDSHECFILKALDIRPDMVYGYIQPWDPIVRMFSRIDPLYPLIGDLGEDGVSLYSSGPPRTLRPILRALLESWEDWPSFRDKYRFVMSQEYYSTGIQHIFLPDIGRYLTDRLVSVNIATFPIEDMVRISSKDLYVALEETFPLDTFSISLVPTAIRSFIHHFYPAYTDFADFAEKEKNDRYGISDDEKQE